MVDVLDSRSVTKSGFLIAGIGFFLTRFTVTLVVDDPVRFLFAGLLPLVLGLLLAAFGVALAVGRFTPRFTNTVARWTLIGTSVMAVLVVSTIVGAGGMGMRTLEPGPIFSNFLIGGGVGGAIVGVYAGLHQQSRDELRRQANRLATLNRILRDEVLNAVTVIKGHVSLLREADAARSISVISTKADAIEDSIDDVGHLTRTTRTGVSVNGVSLERALQAAVDEARERHPDASISLEPFEDDAVCADRQLGQVFFHLLDNAARYSGPEPDVTVTVEWTRTAAQVRVRDNGPGLPEREQATLEAGDITEFDDPRSGFGLNVVQLLVESYDGSIDTVVDESGTTIEVELVREEFGGPRQRTGLESVRSYGVPTERLVAAVVAALFAGGVMGIGMQVLAGIVPVIGALYGVQDLLVGWVTHEFHSIVFGLIYASLVTAAPRRTHEFAGHLAIAIVWALFLWAFAAGVVMPFWLQLLGLPASLPSLTSAALLTHLLWGVTLGISYHLITTRLLERTPVES